MRSLLQGSTSLNGSIVYNLTPTPCIKNKTGHNCVEDTSGVRTQAHLLEKLLPAVLCVFLSLERCFLWSSFQGVRHIAFMSQVVSFVFPASFQASLLSVVLLTAVESCIKQYMPGIRPLLHFIGGCFLAVLVSLSSVQQFDVLFILGTLITSVQVQHIALRYTSSRSLIWTWVLCWLYPLALLHVFHAHFPRLHNTPFLDFLFLRCACLNVYEHVDRNFMTTSQRFGYLFHYGTLLFGPMVDAPDYIKAVEPKMLSKWTEAILPQMKRCISELVIFSLSLLVLFTYFDVSYLRPSLTLDSEFPTLLQLYLASFVMRVRGYIMALSSESLLLMSGTAIPIDKSHSPLSTASACVPFDMELPMHGSARSACRGWAFSLRRVYLRTVYYPARKFLHLSRPQCLALCFLTIWACHRFAVYFLFYTSVVLTALFADQVNSLQRVPPRLKKLLQWMSGILLSLSIMQATSAMYIRDADVFFSIWKSYLFVGYWYHGFQLLLWVFVYYLI